jgi:hypothetical protein
MQREQQRMFVLYDFCHELCHTVLSCACRIVNAVMPYWAVMRYDNIGELDITGTPLYGIADGAGVCGVTGYNITLAMRLLLRGGGLCCVPDHYSPGGSVGGE